MSSPKRFTQACLAFSLALLVIPVAEAQDAAPTPAPRVEAVKLPFITVGKLDPSPIPYEKEEFPAWARDLRRFEIISLGSFPLTLFYSGLGWDIYRYATAKNAWTGEALGVLPWDSTLRPWPMKNPYSYKPTEDEEKLQLLTAGALSLTVGLVDILIVSLQRRASAAKRSRSLQQTQDAVEESDSGPLPAEAAEISDATELTDPIYATDATDEAVPEGPSLEEGPSGDGP